MNQTSRPYETPFFHVPKILFLVDYCVAYKYEEALCLIGHGDIEHLVLCVRACESRSAASRLDSLCPCIVSALAVYGTAFRSRLSLAMLKPLPVEGLGARHVRIR